MYNFVTGKAVDREHFNTKDNKLFKCKLSCCQSCSYCPGHSQRKELSPGSAGCYLIQEKLKYVKGASCVTQLSCAKPVTDVPIVVTNLPVGARLQNFRSGPLCALLWRILTWCTSHQVILRARHIPGRLNVVTDKLFVCYHV